MGSVVQGSVFVVILEVTCNVGQYVWGACKVASTNIILKLCSWSSCSSLQTHKYSTCVCDPGAIHMWKLASRSLCMKLLTSSLSLLSVSRYLSMMLSTSASFNFGLLLFLSMPIWISTDCPFCSPLFCSFPRFALLSHISLQIVLLCQSYDIYVLTCIWNLYLPTPPRRSWIGVIVSRSNIGLLLLLGYVMFWKVTQSVYTGPSGAFSLHF